MSVKILIILFFLLPQALSFSANTKFETGKNHLSAQPSDSNALYNSALKEQRAGNLALSLALAEKSLYINPLNFDSMKLINLASDKLRAQNNEQMEGVPTIYKILDLIPYWFLIVISAGLTLVFAYVLGLTWKKETITFKTQPQKRLHAVLSASALTLGTILLFLKVESQAEQWACVVSEEVRLFTGPNSENFPQVSTLSAGNCSAVVLVKDTWISLSPSNKASGWTLKSEVLIVRGNKFDPLFKSD